MTAKQGLIFGGVLLSIILLIIVFARLDWQAFLTALTTIRVEELLLAVVIIVFNVALRSLRWNLVAGMPISEFKHFWQAANIGYLGNTIYPARAGEVLRIAAIHRFAGLTIGRAVTSAVIDRMLDMLTVGSFLLFVVWLHGSQRLGIHVGLGAIAIFGVMIVTLVVAVTFADRWQVYVQNWSGKGKWRQRIREWCLHALEGIQEFSHVHNLFFVGLLSLLVFLLDFFWLWQIMAAFGWSLPFETAITVGTFLLLGASLPSAPGYVGIYQVACVLALRLYDVNESQAVAYSIVLQLLNFTVIGTQGLLVAIRCSFNLSKVSAESLQD